MAPEILARLPFRALYSKLQGQPAVLRIRSLVSQGAAMPLEEQRSKTESMINEAIQRMQGWRDRTVLLQCLNSVVPMEGNLTGCNCRTYLYLFVTSMRPSWTFLFRLLALLVSFIQTNNVRAGWRKKQG